MENRAFTWVGYRLGEQQPLFRNSLACLCSYLILSLSDGVRNLCLCSIEWLLVGVYVLRAVVDILLGGYGSRSPRGRSLDASESTTCPPMPGAKIH
jgi:hypothetical protein